jgi:hypothetical protein
MDCFSSKILVTYTVTFISNLLFVDIFNRYSYELYAES